MMYVLGAGIIMLLAFALVAVSYRGKAKAEQRHAELQQQRAEAAEVANQHRQQLDTTLATLHETQRQETIDATNPTHLAARSDFDNNWSAATGLRESDANADTDVISTAATDSTGAATDYVGRADLSERWGL